MTTTALKRIKKELNLAGYRLEPVKEKFENEDDYVQSIGTCVYELCQKFSEQEANQIIAELRAENERLKEENFNFEEVIKLCKCELYQQTLQKIKDYLNTLSGIDSDFVNTETYLRILDLITKAEETNQ